MRVKVVLGQTDASYSQHIVDVTHIAGNLVLCLLQFVGVLLQLSVRMGNLGYITSRTEETDALTLIVSEETGHLSYSYKGTLWSNVTPEELRGELIRLQNKLSQEEAAKNTSRSPLGSISGIGRYALRRTKTADALPEDQNDNKNEEAVDAAEEGGANE